MSLKSGVNTQKISTEKIRNFCIIAHVDHGKSTLADWLISSAKLISEQPGRRFLDTREDEKQRGITIKSTSITYVLKQHIFNLIDCPGHVDFGANVTTALRACDGALLLIDAVEGMMPQTVSVLKQAVVEHIVPILFINKLDRLFTQLNLSVDEIKDRLQTLISSVNAFIESIDSEKKVETFSFRSGNIILGAGLIGWALNLAEGKYTLRQVLNKYENGVSHELKSIMPLAECVTNTLINKCPSPIDAQVNKLQRLGTQLSEQLVEYVTKCSSENPLLAIVVGIQSSKQRGRLVSVRLLSGRVKIGQKIYISRPQGTNNLLTTIGRVCINLGKQLEEFEHLPSGMLAVLTGLSDVNIGDTISDIQEILPFSNIVHSSQPVMAVSFSPKDGSKVAKLKQLLLQQCAEDITLQYEFNSDTRQHILKGLGKLHIEVVLNRIQKQQRIQLDITEPTVIYLETIEGESSIQKTVTSNKLNKFSISVLSIDECSAKKISKYEHFTKIVDFHKLIPKQSTIYPYAKNIIVNERSNVLINNTKSVQFMQESLPNVILGFRKAMNFGPVLKKQVVNVAVLLQDADWHVDFVHRTPSDIAPPTQRLIHSCMNQINVKILQPYIKCYITADLQYFNSINRCIKSSKGKLMEVEYGDTSVTVITLIPVKDSFNLPQQLMKATEGRLNWRYEPGDYDVMSQLQLDILKARETQN